jgi:flagellar basal body rod protein FlgG
MPKVTYKHLEQVRKALLNSNKVLTKSPVDVIKTTKAAEINQKAIDMLDEEYLDIKQ